MEEISKLPANPLMFLGTKFYKLGGYYKALQFYLIAYPKIDIINQTEQGFASYNIARAYVGTKNFKEALKWFQISYHKKYATRDKGRIANYMASLYATIEGISKEEQIKNGKIWTEKSIQQGYYHSFEIAIMFKKDMFTLDDYIKFVKVYTMADGKDVNKIIKLLKLEFPQKINYISEKIFDQVSDQLKNVNKSINNCAVCLSKQAIRLVTPCMHLCLCDDCSDKKYERCPMCRGKIEEIKKVYIS